MRFANSGTKMPQHQPIAHDGFHLAKPAFSEHSNVDYLINKFKRTRTFPSLPKLIHDPPSSSRPRYDKTPRSRESNGDFVANIDCLLHDGSLLQELARSLASDSCSIFSCLSTWYETEAVWFWAFEAMFIISLFHLRLLSFPFSADCYAVLAGNPQKLHTTTIQGR